MEELLELLGELQELCKRRHSLDVPGQCPPVAQGLGLGLLLSPCRPPPSLPHHLP